MTLAAVTSHAESQKLRRTTNEKAEEKDKDMKDEAKISERNSKWT